MSFEQLIACVGRLERHPTLGLTPDQARALLPSLRRFATWQKSSADRGQRVAELLTPAQKAVVEKTRATVAAGTILEPVSAEQVLGVLDGKAAR